MKFSLFPLSDRLLKKWDGPLNPWGNKPLTLTQKVSYFAATAADITLNVAVITPVAVSAMLIVGPSDSEPTIPRYNPQNTIGKNPECEVKVGFLRAVQSSISEDMPNMRVTIDALGVGDGTVISGNKSYVTEPSRPGEKNLSGSQPLKGSDRDAASSMLKRCFEILQAK